VKIKQKIFNGEMLMLIGVTAVPVNIWTVLTTMEWVPSWVLSNTSWDLIGSLSYPLAFALVEILTIFLPLVFLRLALPEKWMRDKFLSFGFLYVLEFTIFVLLLQNNDALFWQKRLLLLGFVGGLVLIFLLVYFIPFVKKICDFLADRFAILGFFLMVFNLLAVVIVLIRNIS
jgi:hypothetical protein